MVARGEITKFALCGDGVAVALVDLVTAESERAVSVVVPEEDVGGGDVTISAEGAVAEAEGFVAATAALVVFLAGSP